MSTISGRTRRTCEVFCGAPRSPDYLTAQPHWQTVLDYDALGKQDHQTMGSRRALVPLSRQRALHGGTLRGR